MNRALAQFLLSFTSITNLVGERIRGNHMEPGETLPAVVIKRTSTEFMPAFDVPGTMRTATFTVDCHADNAFDADDLAEAVSIALDGYCGLMGAANRNVTACTCTDQSGDWDEPIDASNTGVDKESLTVIVQYELPGVE